LAREFARLRRERYSGGTFVLDASKNAFALELASLGEKILGFTFPAETKFEDRGRRTFLALSREPVLLIYDNVVSFDQVQPWLPYSGMPCHVLITTQLDTPTRMWPCLEVKPLTPAQSVELVEKLTNGRLDQATARSVAAHSGGLPVQILPHAAALAGERRWRRRQSSFPIAVETGDSFRTAYSRLDRPARLLLHAAAFFNTQHIPSAEITRHLEEGLDRTEDQVEQAFAGCFELHLLQGSTEPRMHQLFAAFVKETPLPEEDRAVLARVTAVQASRFLELAQLVSANPADLEQVTLLLDYPLTPAIWEVMGRSFTAEQETAGHAVLQVGRFEEARPWYERAVAEKEKGDVDGSVDHESLGSSLHHVGYCYSSTGRFEEARPWFERSVKEKEEGDVHGRVDHASLGRSLNQVGDCYSSTGRFEEARPWYERAVAEKEKGDVHGRVDHASLGRSLHQVGYCYSRTGRFEEARPWFERAVEEAGKGDVHGRLQSELVTTFIQNLAALLRKLGRNEEARQWEQRYAQGAGN